MSNFSSLLLDIVKFDVFVCLVNRIFFLLLLLSPEGLISSIALGSPPLSFPSALHPTDGFMCQEVIFKMSPPSLTNKASLVLKFCLWSSECKSPNLMGVLLMVSRSGCC